MNGTEQERFDGGERSWEQIGRAAEDFARRVARDAAKFAARMEEHAGEFADDVSRDWRRARHRHRRHHRCRSAAAPEIRRVFDDVRDVLADVLDGVDELIERIFPGTPAADPGAATDDGDWVRVVANRQSTCARCGRILAVGEPAFVCRHAGNTEFCCPGCAPTEGAES